MAVPINRATAHNVAAMMLAARDEDAANRIAVVTVEAIIAGHDRIGMTRGQAEEFAARFIAAALAEYGRLRDQPPRVH